MSAPAAQPAARLLRYHDGERFCAALEVSEGRKYRHLVVITDGGVRYVEAPLEQPVEPLGVVTRKQLATFRRCGRVFGITQAAEAALELAAVPA